MKSRRNITRVHHVGGSGGLARGWWVRLIRNGKVRANRFFSDAQYGSAVMLRLAWWAGRDTRN